MSYEQLQNDLDHLLLTSQVIAEHKHEQGLIHEAGDCIDMTMRLRDWLADMVEHSDQHARSIIDRMSRRLPQRAEQPALENREEISRLVQYFANGDGA